MAELNERIPLMGIGNVAHATGTNPRDCRRGCPPASLRARKRINTKYRGDSEERSIRETSRARAVTHRALCRGPILDRCITRVLAPGNGRHGRCRHAQATCLMQHDSPTGCDSSPSVVERGDSLVGPWTDNRQSRHEVQVGEGGATIAPDAYIGTADCSRTTGRGRVGPTNRSSWQLEVGNRR